MTAKIFPNFDVAPYPTAMRIFQNCMALDAFVQAQPARQPDAPKSS